MITFRSAAHDPRVTARVGLWLGVAFGICFVTGLISHGIQHPPVWFSWPSRPVNLYRVTQGLHVLSGIAAIPLLLAKLWSAYSKLFARPLVRSLPHALERLSILVLTGAAFFELVTGLFNVAQNYLWGFYFPTAHYAVAWVAIGSILVHVAVKLPIIRRALTREPAPELDVPHDTSARPDGELSQNENPGIARPDDEGTGAEVARDEAHQPVGAFARITNAALPSGPTESDLNSVAAAQSRRRFLRTTWLGSAVAVLVTAGATVPFLRDVSVLSWRSGRPLPVNRTASAAGIMVPEGWRLEVVTAAATRTFSLADLNALPQATEDLPISCVEGWSAMARWTGVRMVDLLRAVDAAPGSSVRAVSLEKGSIYSTSILPGEHTTDPATLLALQVNGEVLPADHGFPCRIIAPSRPGVLQTKWVTRLEIT
ncbi:MAG: molybdopterin-dependent oxidoreductase [Actinomycetota bacterium]|nr:molybdopterin-dependent oxidoreductase [Actinomycetota bacterium]